jgi:hypothetical protein
MFFVTNLKKIIKDDETLMVIKNLILENSLCDTIENLRDINNNKPIFCIHISDSTYANMEELIDKKYYCVNDIDEMVSLAKTLDEQITSLTIDRMIKISKLSYNEGLSHFLDNAI